MRGERGTIVASCATRKMFVRVSDFHTYVSVCEAIVDSIEYLQSYYEDGINLCIYGGDD